MARHGKKPSEESTSSHTPRTLAGSATTCTSADSIDAAASGIAVNSSTVSSAFASESRQPQDLFDTAIAQGISDGDAWTDQHVKHIYRQIIITVVVVVVVLGAVFGFTGVRASQQMRDLAALNDCKEAVTAMNTSYSKAFQLRAKISEAFTSLDGSYDLDKLAELHQTPTLPLPSAKPTPQKPSTTSRPSSSSRLCRRATNPRPPMAVTEPTIALTERTEPQPRTALPTSPTRPTQPTLDD